MCLFATGLKKDVVALFYFDSIFFYESEEPMHGKLVDGRGMDGDAVV